MDLQKRNLLIAALQSKDKPIGGDKLLTDNDRRAIESAHAAERTANTPAVAVFFVPADEEQDIEIELEPVLRLQGLLGGEGLNVGPLLDDPEKFAGMNGAQIFEALLRRQRAASAGPVHTVDASRFFDGNTDRASIAPNIVDSDGGPSFELIRDTLLGLADRADVAAVGVEIHELPNPDNAADDDIWLAAERIFIWTSATLKAVRGWLKPLAPDGVARIGSKLVAPPDGVQVPKGSRVYSVAWD